MLGIQELKVVRLEIFRDGTGEFALTANAKKGDNLFGFSVDRAFTEDVDKTLIVLLDDEIVKHVISSSKKKERYIRYKISMTAAKDGVCKVFFKHAIKAWTNSYLITGSVNKLQKGRFCYIYNDMYTPISDVTLIINTRKMMENRPRRTHMKMMAMAETTEPKVQTSLSAMAMDEKRFIFTDYQMENYSKTKTPGNFTMDPHKFCRLIMPPPMMNIEFISDILHIAHGDDNKEDVNPTTYAAIKYFEDLIGGDLEIMLEGISISTQLPDDITNEVVHIPLKTNMKTIINTKTNLISTNYDVTGVRSSDVRTVDDLYTSKVKFVVKKETEHELIIWYKMNSKGNLTYVYLDTRDIKEFKQIKGEVVKIKGKTYRAIPLPEEKMSLMVLYTVVEELIWDIPNTPKEQLALIKRRNTSTSLNFFDLMEAFEVREKRPKDLDMISNRIKGAFIKSEVEDETSFTFKDK